MACYYNIEDGFIELPSEKEMKHDNGEKTEAALAVLCEKEAMENVFLQSLGYPAVAAFSQIHFCKAEVYLHFLYGTYLSPVMEKERGQFTFVLAPDHLYLIEEGEMVKNILKKKKKVPTIC